MKESSTNLPNSPRKQQIEPRNTPYSGFSESPNNINRNINRIEETNNFYNTFSDMPIEPQPQPQQQMFNFPLNLQELFRNFKLQDMEHTEGFLDFNDEEAIRKQIEDYLLSINLQYEDLTLYQLKSNSVILKSFSNFKYRGEILLTWNLKLFEIWGLGVSSIDEYVTNGLKGYVYLEYGTNQIKYFDYLGNKTSSISQMHPYYGEYVNINFLNINTEEQKDCIIKGKYWSHQIEQYFGSFDFVNELEISLTVQHPDKAKIFNVEENIWDSITENITNKYTTNSLGQMIETTW